MVLEHKMRNLNSVHELVEYVSAVTQKAVILENVDFELIAYSAPNEYSFDTIQQKTILTKRCPLYVIEQLKKEGIISKLQADSQPIRVKLLEDRHFYQRIAKSVQYRGKLFGYLWIYEAEEEFDEEKLSIISEVARKIGKILYHEQANEVDDVSSFLWKLVNGEFSSMAEIDHVMKRVNFHPPNYFTISVISIKEAKDVPILEKIQQIFTSFHFVSYLGKGTEIIGLIPGRTEQEVTMLLDNFIDEIFDTFWLEKEPYIIGVGNMYDNLIDIRKSYLQALEAIEIVTFLNLNDKSTYYYTELGMYRHLKTLYKTNVSEQYRNKKIVALMRKDFSSKSELVKTLYYFLKNDGKVKQTANDLFIHSNTLHYRLKQIEQLIDIDFNNMLEKTSLFSELYLLHHVPDYEAFYKEVIRPDRPFDQ